MVLSLSKVWDKKQAALLQRHAMSARSPPWCKKSCEQSYMWWMIRKVGRKLFRTGVPNWFFQAPLHRTNKDLVQYKIKFVKHPCWTGIAGELQRMHAKKIPVLPVCDEEIQSAIDFLISCKEGVTRELGWRLSMMWSFCWSLISLMMVFGRVTDLCD